MIFDLKKKTNSKTFNLQNRENKNNLVCYSHKNFMHYEYVINIYYLIYFYSCS